MAKSGHVQRYLLIIRKVTSSHYISLKQLINEVEKEIIIYEDADTVGTSKSTIRRDIKDIQKIFGINIIYSKANNGYYILEDEKFDIERQLEYFDLYRVLDTRLKNIVFAERRKSKGTEHLYYLISAIKSSKRVEFKYRKFDNTITKETRIIEPYALKEFKGRWYLLGVEVDGRPQERGQIKTWGLDRICNLYPTNISFSKNQLINIEKEFNGAFGIFSDKDKEIEEVILSFKPEAGRYNESLPLHESQKTLIDSNEEFRIRLEVKLTYDFIMELLSQSENMKVIAPSHLRDTLIDIHRKAIKMLEDVDL